MRRWWKRILAILALFVALPLTVLYVSKPESPYDFLAGQKPVEPRYRPVDPKVYVYTFKADFAALNAIANRELIEKGYIRKMDEDQLTAVYQRKEADPPRTIKRGLYILPPSPDRVTISNNTTAKAGTGADTIFSAKEGWVTIIVEDATSDTLLDRLRDSLGL